MRLISGKAWQAKGFMTGCLGGKKGIRPLYLLL
jgi:hypothetical protein